MKNYDNTKEAELKKRLQLVESIAKTGFWSYYLDTNTLKWDDRMHELYEVDPSDFKGKYSDWSDRVHPDDIEEASSSFQKSVETNGQFEYVFRINAPSGIKHVKAAAIGTKLVDGKYTAMYGVNIDYTDEVNQAKEAKRAAELYKVLVEQNPNATAMLDKDMRYLAASDKWLEEYGLKGRDILGESHYDIFPEIGEEWKAIHRECLNGKGSKEDRDKFVRADGSVQYLRWNIQPWRKGNGEVGGMIMFTEDITEMVSREEKSKEIADYFSNAKKVARIGVWEVDMRTGLSYWDEVVADIYKTPIGWYPPNPEDGIAFYKEGESRETILRVFQDLVDHGKSYDVELQLTNAEGQDIWVRAIGNPVYNEEGTLIKVTGLFQDINDKKLAELEKDATLQRLELMAERLSTQNKSLLDFAHITSHNLRAPVGNMMSLTDLYHDFSEEEKPLVFEKIQNEVAKLSDTLNDLIEALVIRESIAKFDEEVIFDTIVTKITQSLSQQINAHNFKITSEFEACKGILSNRTYIESVFLNLISNALKYRTEDQEPKLHITAKPKGRQVQIQFIDNGIGIDLSRYESKVFGLYNTFHRGYDSRGLGLFMVKTHVESLGGKITVQSQLKKGTTFTIELPAETL